MPQIRIMYHTQEYRGGYLTSPIKCVREDAWLGEGYYYWRDIEDAIHWGNKSKARTGRFVIYESKINCENVLDTVFNEEVYTFWMRQIEKVAKNIIKKTNIKPSLKEINEYFKERAQWKEVDGILFQDIPLNENLISVKLFYYRKRIQLAVYNIGIIDNFVINREQKCS